MKNHYGWQDSNLDLAELLSTALQLESLSPTRIKLKQRFVIEKKNRETMYQILLPFEIEYSKDIFNS